MTLCSMHIVRLPLPRLMHPQKCNMQATSFQKKNLEQKQAFGDSNTNQQTSSRWSSLPAHSGWWKFKKSCVHQLIQLVLYHSLSPVQWYNALLVSSQVVYSGFLNHPRLLSSNSFGCCLLLQVLNIHCRIMFAACGQVQMSRIPWLDGIYSKIRLKHDDQSPNAKDMAKWMSTPPKKKLTWHGVLQCHVSFQGVVETTPKSELT